MTLSIATEVAVEPDMAPAEPHAPGRHRPSHRRSRPGKIVLMLLSTVLLGFAVLIAYWAMSGGRWFIVETPSMGTAAPVGTLLWVKPVPYDNIHAGDFIVFHPPGTHQTFSHRVYTVNADGTLTTKGDINGATDAWRLHPSNVVGQVSMRWWGMGWVVRAAPILIIGGLVLWLLVTRCTLPRLRLPVATVGVAVLVSLSVYVLNPLVRAVQISFSPATGGARATYVSSGLLPLRFSTGDGRHVDLGDGHVGSSLVTKVDRYGRYAVHLRPHLSIWFWVVLVLVCFLPTLYTVIIGLPSSKAPSGEPTEQALGDLVTTG